MILVEPALGPANKTFARLGVDTTAGGAQVGAEPLLVRIYPFVPVIDNVKFTVKVSLYVTLFNSKTNWDLYSYLL